MKRRISDVGRRCVTVRGNLLVEKYGWNWRWNLGTQLETRIAWIFQLRAHKLNYQLSKSGVRWYACFKFTVLGKFHGLLSLSLSFLPFDLHSFFERRWLTFTVVFSSSDRLRKSVPFYFLCLVISTQRTFVRFICRANIDSVRDIVTVDKRAADLYENHGFIFPLFFDAFTVFIIVVCRWIYCTLF